MSLCVLSKKLHRLLLLSFLILWMLFLSTPHPDIRCIFKQFQINIYPIQSLYPPQQLQVPLWDMLLYQLFLCLDYTDNLQTLQSLDHVFNHFSVLLIARVTYFKLPYCIIFVSLHTLATFHHWCWFGAKRVQYPKSCLTQVLCSIHCCTIYSSIQDLYRPACCVCGALSRWAGPTVIGFFFF